MEKQGECAARDASVESAASVDSAEHVEHTVNVAPVGFQSCDGKTAIKGLIWTPVDVRGARGLRAHMSQHPRGIVQIVHGMTEHVGRYDEFARFLAARGFVVCAADHIGHGKSVDSADELGVLPVCGKEILIGDVHELRRIVEGRYPRQVPYILFGHSMGSFIARAYLARHGQGVAAAVLCGTGQQPIIVSRAGNLLARALAALKGADYRSSLLDRLGVGAYAHQIADARTPFDWLCTDDAVVDTYRADDLCGVMFSVGGYAALTSLTAEVASCSCARKVPPNLPLLFIAGACDPVGDFGAGVQRAADLARRAGSRQVNVRLYEGMRHEILNEPGRRQVFEDIAVWMEDNACQQRMS
ncbi:alpha/beta fold hydrolase [Adlercreutzia sp. ZJ141]|uniref:alpha/beta fold hydrolase n=1 Tax=Adlercreutzia sp. ZJ141 TaxID=2709406 RepID=UPI0013EBC8B9|nr:alpha/beta fold hydrolase [Adlercreutzia sp. ZJ141]